jgi:hypothetical protein
VLLAGRAEIPPLMMQRMPLGRRRLSKTLFCRSIHMWMRASAVRIAHVQLQRRENLANLSAECIAGCPTSMVGGLESHKKFGRFLCTK